MSRSTVVKRIQIKPFKLLAFPVFRKLNVGEDESVFKDSITRDEKTWDKKKPVPRRDEIFLDFRIARDAKSPVTGADSIVRTIAAAQKVAIAMDVYLKKWA